jgi:ATP-dependent Clp protease ATP-binding subunit ClpB
MLSTNGITLDVTDAAVEWIATGGYDPQFGARPVKRVIQRSLLNELSKRILSGELSRDGHVTVDVSANGDALTMYSTLPTQPAQPIQLSKVDV